MAAAPTSRWAQCGLPGIGRIGTSRPGHSDLMAIARQCVVKPWPRRCRDCWMASAADSQRLCFALWPDDTLRHILYKETRHAVRASGGKPVLAENFHITLAFLGHLDVDGAAAARAAADSTQGEPFDLVLDRTGFWPDARVVWLGPSAVP